MIRPYDRSWAKLKALYFTRVKKKKKTSLKFVGQPHNHGYLLRFRQDSMEHHICNKQSYSFNASDTPVKCHTWFIFSWEQGSQETFSLLSHMALKLNLSFCSYFGLVQAVTNCSLHVVKAKFPFIASRL